MSESLDAWYQRELDYFRHSASDFAERFPKIANRLSLSGKDIRDPHVERLIQAFAYLNARTRHKLDDSFPELADAMLGILYPHMLSPIPSLSMVSLELSPTAPDLTEGHYLPAGTLIESESIRDHQCRFQTCFPLQLYPFEAESVRLLPPPFSGGASPGKQFAQGVLRLKYKTFDAALSFGDIGIETLRFHVNISNFEKAARLLEAILTGTIEVVITGSDFEKAVSILPASCLKAVGFDRKDAVLPDDPRSFPGYRLLTEYFVFPQKFLFFELTGLTKEILDKVGAELEISILLKDFPEELQNEVSPDSVRLGCTPIINLFHQTADAIPLSHRTSEYRILPDARAEEALEIYSVDSVSVEDQDGDAKDFRRFYSVEHDRSSEETGYWHAVRRPGPVDGDQGTLNQPTQMYISIVDPDFSPRRSGHGMLYTRLTCFNRDLPEELANLKTADQMKFDIVGGRGPVGKIDCLTSPTPTLRRHLGRRNLWPLVSQLSLNHLSLVDSDDAVKSIRELLTLNDVKESVETRNLIDGLASIHSERCVQRVNGAFARGTKIHVLFNDENFKGDSAYLFASVLNQFFGMYTSVNSFVKLSAITRSMKSRNEDSWTWTAQAGERALI